MEKYSLILIILFISFSCQTKKQVSKLSIETKTESILVEKKEKISVTQNAINIKEDIDEIEIVPIDQSKPIVVGGKEYFNATLKIKSTKKELTDNTKATVADISDKKIEVKKEETIKESIKEVDRKVSYFNWLWLLLLFIPVLLWIFKKKLKFPFINLIKFK